MNHFAPMDRDRLGILATAMGDNRVHVAATALVYLDRAEAAEAALVEERVRLREKIEALRAHLKAHVRPAHDAGLPIIAAVNDGGQSVLVSVLCYLDGELTALDPIPPAPEPIKPEPCEACGGDRVLPILDIDLNGEGQYINGELPCPICKGTGENPKNQNTKES